MIHVRARSAAPVDAVSSPEPLRLPDDGIGTRARTRRVDGLVQHWERHPRGGPGERPDQAPLEQLLLDALAPTPMAPAHGIGASHQVLLALADRLEQAAADGDRLVRWSALIVRHEANKQDLLRQYLDGTP